MPDTLAAKSCTPCRGGIPSLTIEEAQVYLAQAPGWDLLDDGRMIQRTYRFKNFREALGFVQRAGELAEAEGCPSSDDLRQRPGLGKGGSGSRMEAMRPGRDAASGDWRWSCV
jgi:hypothetical protein